MQNGPTWNGIACCLSTNKSRSVSQKSEHELTLGDKSTFIITSTNSVVLPTNKSCFSWIVAASSNISASVDCVPNFDSIRELVDYAWSFLDFIHHFYFDTWMPHYLRALCASFKLTNGLWMETNWLVILVFLIQCLQISHYFSSICVYIRDSIVTCCRIFF